MNREQMIAWLTLEGWSYWYWPPDTHSWVGVDWFRKGDAAIVFTDRRYKLQGDTVHRESHEEDMNRLMTADIALAVAYIQENGL